MKLNRNNADINKLRDRKVAVRLVGKGEEIDFRKWLKENGIHFNYKEYLLIGNWAITETCYCIEGNSWDWYDEKWFIEKGYEIYEWEIVEEKTYTIKDVVENVGKVYKCITDSNCGVLYKYVDDVLYVTNKCGIEWRKSLVGLRKLLKYEFIECKPEPKEITFEEALKEMETKVCRCLFSNRSITVYASHFVDCSNGAYTSLSLPELQSRWVVIGE